ncbi:hypothetical protein Dimus_036391 [Dionaea muscipula]
MLEVSTTRSSKASKTRMVQKKERCEKLQSDPFIGRLPATIRDYISSIGNVKGDGHCGFRAIAAQIGYGEAG